LADCADITNAVANDSSVATDFVLIELTPFGSDFLEALFTEDVFFGRDRCND